MSPGPASSTRPLTPVQTRILKAITDSVRTRGYPPTTTELRRAVGLASPSTVAYHLRRLQDLGYITVAPRTPRGITVRCRTPQGEPPSGAVETAAARIAELTGFSPAMAAVVADAVCRDLLARGYLTGTGEAG